MNNHSEALQSARYLSGFNAVVIATLVTFSLVSVVFPSTLVDIVDIWIRSETYNHCFLVIPAFIYLVWLKRHQIEGLPLRPEWFYLFALLPLVFLWLLASLIDVAVVEQFSFVTMAVVILVMLLGSGISKRIAFPIAFLMLAIPVGEELVPIMIDFTAFFTVELLRLLGYPVFREGNNFALPSGNWSVVEACSGVRYLIASFTIGLIYAYMTYVSLSRRLAFIALSLIVPIIANGLRAVIIVLIGHYSGMTLATGADHLVYGWVFFGFVMFVMFWIGGYWREDEVDRKDPNPSIAQPTETISVSRLSKAFVINGLLAIAMMVSGKAWFNHMQNMNEPQQYPAWPMVNGELTCSDCSLSLLPSFQNADAYLQQQFKVGDLHHPIQLYVARYVSWSGQGELINSQNLPVVSSDSNKSVTIKKEKVLISGDLHATRVEVGGYQKYLMYYFRTIDQTSFASDIVGKLVEAAQRLKMKPFHSDFVAVYAPYEIESKDVEPLLKQAVIEAYGLKSSIQ